MMNEKNYAGSKILRLAVHKSTNYFMLALLLAGLVLYVYFANTTVRSLAMLEKTKQEIDWLLDYTSSHTDAKITYTVSNMILKIHSDASYLSVPPACSRLGGYFYSSLGASSPILNAPILRVSKILKMSSFQLLKPKLQRLLKTVKRQ